MSEPYAKCDACDRPFSGSNPYFSADFARYFSPTNNFALTWCFSCARVLIYRRPFIHRLTRLPVLRFKEAHGLPVARETAYLRQRDRYLGFVAGVHLMRMIWHCLCERVEVNGYRGSRDAAAMHLALKKLPARDVAVMAAITIHARRVIPVEQQIQEGLYVGDRWHPESLVRSWIESSPDMYPRLLALSHLDEMLAHSAHASQ